MGSDQRDRRVAVVNQAGTVQAQAQAECRWQSKHRRRIEEALGGEEGREYRTRGCKEGEEEGCCKKTGKTARVKLAANAPEQIAPASLESEIVFLIPSLKGSAYNGGDG